MTPKVKIVEPGDRTVYALPLAQQYSIQVLEDPHGDLELRISVIAEGGRTVHIALPAWELKDAITDHVLMLNAVYRASKVKRNS